MGGSSRLCEAVRGVWEVLGSFWGGWQDTARARSERDAGW